MVTLSCSDPYIIVTDYSELYPVIPAGQTISVENGFAFSINSDVPDQHPVTFSLSSSNGEITWESTFIVTVNAPILHINSITIDDSAGGNGDGELDPGESAAIMINYSNTGHAVAYDVDAFLEGQSGFTEISDPQQNFASIGFLGAFNKTYHVDVDTAVPEGINVDFVNELTMGQLVLDKVFPVKISAKIEDFETGDFSQFNWQQNGNLPWQIISQYPYQGFFSAKSGAITHNQTSEISLIYKVMEDDSIIFYRKVSSESSDFLKFYINNQVIGSWSGTTGGWKREAFAVSAGTKTFKWAYEKNAVGSAGSDCAWLDNIQFPAPLALTIWAGPDDKVCTGESYNMSESYGTDYTQVEWTTSGTGTFDDNTNIRPNYTPSTEDISSGEVTLTLTLWDDQANMVSDGMTLGFKDIPAVPSVPQGPEYVDLALDQTSDYSVAQVDGSEDYTWQLEPAEAGMIIGDQTYATVSWNNDFTGTAYIKVAGYNECGEGSYSEALAVVVENTLTGIPENGNAGFTVKIYPNPVTDVLNVEVSGENTEGAVISLVDGMGKVYSRLSRSIDVESIRAGLYLLIVESNGQRVIRKIIKN
jgi:hypothetical protein